VTDRVNAPIVGAALATLGEPPDVVVCPDGKDVAREVLAAERPTCLVAIERPGRNHAGDYLSMRGQSVAAGHAPPDASFRVPSRARGGGVADRGRRGGGRAAPMGRVFGYHTGMKIRDEYRAKHPKSAALWERARAVIPGGITHDIRHLTPFPVYVERALGSRKWDVDGHEYVDYWMGHGALFLGHCHPAVVRAVQEQMARSTHPGACHE